MKKIFSLLLAFSMSVSLSACSSNSSTTSGEKKKTSSSSETIKVGLITAFSGPASVYGPPVKNSAQLAIDEINKSGGLQGKQLELIAGDTATDPKTASDQAKALLNNQKVDALFAETTSAERNAVTPVADKSGRLFFYNVIYEGGAYSDNMYIDGEVPDQQITPVFPHIMETFKGKKWFIIGEDYVWPRETSKAVHKTVEGVGGQVVGEEYVPLGNSEFSSLLTKIQTVKPDFISLETNGPAAVAFMKQFHALGMEKTTKVVALAVDENSLTAMGEAGTGLLLSAAYFHDMDTTENKAFLEKYYTQFGKDAPKPNFITVGTYDAIHLWAKAVQNASSLEVGKVREQLSKVSFKGPRGEVSYESESHHSKLPIYLSEVQTNGKVKIIHSFGSVSPGNQKK